MREITSEYLKHLVKCKVETADSAISALQKMKQTTYDAIISDYQMPEMDGIGFLKTVRASNPSIPFIIFTGKGREEIAIKAYESGADFYVQKGGDPKSQFIELTHKLNQAIKQKRAEENLRKSEELYRNVVETQTELICRFLPDNTHIFVNEAYCRYFDTTREDIVGTQFVPRVPPQEQDVLREHFSSLTCEDPIKTIEHRIILPRGGIRWVRWNDRAIYNENAVCVEYQSVGQDITELKEMEEALKCERKELSSAYEEIAAIEEELRHNYEELARNQKELKEREKTYHEFFATSMDCIFITSRDGEWLDFNDSAVRFFGYSSREDLQGSNIRDFYARPGDRDSHIAFLTENGYSGKYPIDMVKKDGTIIHTLFSSIAVKETDGTIARFQGTVHDVTEQKKAECELLRVKRQMNFFNSIVQHDIVNVLTSMSGYLDFTRTIKMDPKIAEIMGLLEQLTEKIFSEIEFIRTFQDLGTREPQWQDVRSILSRMKFPPATRVTINCPGVEIYADIMLENVFSIINTNSIRHGGHVDEVGVKCTELPVGLSIMYEDNGVGVQYDEKQKIFELGYGKNRGYGLFLAREILALTGIIISETGEAGKGARFEILVPNGSYRFVCPR